MHVDHRSTSTDEGQQLELGADPLVAGDERVVARIRPWTARCAG